MWKRRKSRTCSKLLSWMRLTTPRSSRQGTKSAIDDLSSGYRACDHAARFSGLSRSDLVLWHLADIPERPANVRYWSNSGQTSALGLDLSAAIDPNVWSGRALQVDFAELAVSGLASMYPASDWSVLCSGPSWISARVRSH